MKVSPYQTPELRNESDAVIQVGTYGKYTPFANAENTGILDYINNNLEALKNALSGAYVYVANKASLPTSGDATKIYVTQDDGKSYKWTGTEWSLLTAQLNGLSAYEIAKANGYTGTEEEWIVSLQGDTITSATVDDEGYLILAMSSGNTIKTALKPIADCIQYRDEAKASATTATEQANKAKTEADSITDSANTAKEQATNASASAANAKTSADNAKASETNAKTSETNAKASEEASANSASEASTSASKALASEHSAITSAGNALDSYTKTTKIQQNFQSVLDTAKASETNAKTSETASATSASNALTSEVNAKTSETNSATSASNAKASETNAKASATDANTSATVAKNWATATDSPDGTTDSDSSTGKTRSSRTWALEAKSSAESASASASTATTQASSARASAESAGASATNASTSASEASTSASNASDSEQKAKTSETNAGNSESNALQYKDSALESKTASATSASNASKSEINAKASANSASASATSASTSASNASVSEQHASASETNAKNALVEAQKIQKEVETALSKVTGFAKYAGSVDNYSDLPTTGVDKGDVWNIVNADTAHKIKAGDNVIWNGTAWDNLSGFVDLSNYPTNSDVAKAIMSTTYSGGTITFIHKDGTKSTATIGDTSHATQADQDGEGNVIADTYYKKSDASTIHQSFQNQINTKQDKLTFDSTPTADSNNPVTSDGIKKAIDAKTVDLSGYYTKTQVDSEISTAQAATETKIPSVDSLLTTSSENPVQNKIVTEELNKKLNASDGTVSISWNEENFLQFKATGSTNSTLISAGAITCSDGEGTRLDIVSAGIAVYPSSSDDAHALLFSEKLEYGTSNNRANIATEDYVDAAITKALSSISDGDSKSY